MTDSNYINYYYDISRIIDMNKYIYVDDEASNEFSESYKLMRYHNEPSTQDDLKIDELCENTIYTPSQSSGQTDQHTDDMVTESMEQADGQSSEVPAQ